MFCLAILYFHTRHRYFNRIFFPTPLQRVRSAISDNDYVTCSTPSLQHFLALDVRGHLHPFSKKNNLLKKHNQKGLQTFSNPCGRSSVRQQLQDLSTITQGSFSVARPLDLHLVKSTLI
jgi:hypothetical protein